MEFSLYFFYTLLLLLVSQVLALSPRYVQPSAQRYLEDNTGFKILDESVREPSYIRRERKTSEEEVDEKMSLFMSKKSNFGYEKSFNDIPKSRIGSVDVEKKKTATFEELEDQNANIHNPLLNLDHYPKPSKKYTFEELEDMNANQYNPYLN